MSCIHDDDIQKYIDMETDANETAMIENHISICPVCDNKIKAQRSLAMDVKKAINKFADEPAEIPVFTFPQGNKKKSSPILVKISWSVAAACILIFLFIITNKKDVKTPEELILSMGSVNINANKPVTDFPLILNFIDSEGNVSEFCIE